MDDLGQFEPKINKVSEKVFDCAYTPRAKQHKQTVFVNFGGVAVPGSPFRVVNDNLNDPTLVCIKQHTYLSTFSDCTIQARI